MSDKKSITGELYRGIITENPTFGLCLGMCPSLATTTSVKNAVGMGLSTTAVLIASNITISVLVHLMKQFSNDELFQRIQKIRIPLFIVVIASFVTVIDFVLKGYFPALSKELGLFIPLIVVNCIILGRAEVYASKNNVFYSFIDGLGMGLGFTGSLALLGAIREILGSGQILGLSLFGPAFKPAIIFVLAPGAFLTIGFVMGFFRYISSIRSKKI